MKEIEEEKEWQCEKEIEFVREEFIVIETSAEVVMEKHANESSLCQQERSRLEIEIE
jgi:hypothetical protein